MVIGKIGSNFHQRICFRLILIVVTAFEDVFPSLFSIHIQKHSIVADVLTWKHTGSVYVLISNNLFEDWGMEQVNEFFHEVAECHYSASIDDKIFWSKERGGASSSNLITVLKWLLLLIINCRRGQTSLSLNASTCE